MSTPTGVPDACGDYHRWYYDTAVWERTTFLGVRTYKSVSDMWNYQEIIAALNPSLIIEFGTWFGGSALFFASLLRSLSSRHRVLSVDVDHSRIDPEAKPFSLFRESIEFLTSSSIERPVAQRIEALRESYPGSVFAILDSDHRKEHVLAEMMLLRPLLRSGDYLVVEDSNINGHPVLPGWGPGPMEAIVEYEAKFAGDYRHDDAREQKFGFTFAPRGFLSRE